MDDTDMDDTSADEPAPTLVAIEVVVLDLETALAFFGSTLGMPVVHRGPALDTAGELAVVDAGGIAVTLLAPVADGDDVLSDRTPRFTQLVFATPDVARLRHRIEQRGIGVEATGPERAFVPPQAAEGVIGPHVALTFTVVDHGADVIGTVRPDRSP
jgi:catechol 2,3-dioxygenase-like lactoylglutathione lyase family enzyme